MAPTLVRTRWWRCGPSRRGGGRAGGRLVWVRGVGEPIVASRSEDAITRDLVAPGDRSLRADQLATALERLVEASESLPPVLQRAIRQETGQDFSALARDGRTALDE